MRRWAYFPLLLLLAAPAALAQPDAAPLPRGVAPFTEEMQQAGDMIRQGLEKMLGSVGGMLRAMPRYEMPRLDENGDIIIKRKHPDEADRRRGERSI